MTLAYLELVESVLSADINKAKEVNYKINIHHTLRGLTFSLEGYSVPAIIKDLIQLIVRSK